MIIFIPIKEKSQRVPGKNFRKINGVELYKNLLYKLSNHQVFIDTDSDLIIDDIKNDKNLKNVCTYKRKEQLIGHEVSVCDLIENFIIEKSMHDKLICQIHVTSPFIKEKTLKDAFSKFASGYDSVVSCNIYQNRLWRKEEYGYCPINHNPLRLEQTQDLPEYYEENSLFYMFQANKFLKTKSRIGNNPFFYACNFPENIDIDTEDDWNIVKTIAGE